MFAGITNGEDSMTRWRHSVRLSALIGFLVLPLVTGTTSAAEDPAVRTKLRTVNVELNADGLSTTLVHSEVQAGNAAGVSQIGQIPVGYSESMEDLDILEAYTLKANGETIAVNTAAIFPQLPPASHHW